MGPRLPSGKVSASGQESSRIVTRFLRTSALYVDLLYVKSYVSSQTASRWFGATQPTLIQPTLLGLRHQRAGGGENRPAAGGRRKPHSHLLKFFSHEYRKNGCRI
ncbi:hypothetical protein AVEN_17826-1 [Araneus ventricosus]|uniref:Uncharacterized protein n=1 Tax=Araneus ventricosus TaxID=182803 RepID=A0A4Y2N2C5_ARAVE|nr:hypothetical protein AVEN_17826-1 [Araneus ventricosus]